MYFIKYFVYLSFIFSGVISCSHQSKPADDLKRAPLSIYDNNTNEQQSLQKRFIKKLNIKMGVYLPSEDDPDSCYEGDIEIINVDNTLSILFGGRLLVAGVTLDKNIESFKERNCSNKINTILSNQTITSYHVKKCQNSETISNKKIEFSKNQITYAIDTKENGKPTYVIKCHLRTK
jgi:hypothetical protein